MLTKLKNAAIVRALRKLPLWAQVVIPIVALVVLVQIVIWLKVLFAIALVLGTIYAIIRASNSGS